MPITPASATASMLHQGAFDLERTDEVAGALDDIVGSPDEPIIAFSVSHREVAGQIPAAHETFAIAFFLMEIGAHHRRPAWTQSEFAHRHRFGHLVHRAGFIALDDAGDDARQGTSHRPGLHVHRSVVGDHDAAGLGLPPIVVKRHPEDLGTPYDRFGIERLTDTGDEAQVGKIEPFRDGASHLHQHADRGGGRVPDRDFLILQDAVPALGIEFGLVHDEGRAVRQRRDDAVRGSGHPSGVGRAPEDIVGLEIKRELAGDVMRHDGFVHVHGALWPSGCAAGEVQKGHVFRTGPYRVEPIGRRRQRGRKIDRVRWRIA